MKQLFLVFASVISMSLCSPLIWAQEQLFNIIHTANKYQAIHSFQEGFAKVETKNRCGVINQEGKEIIPCHFLSSFSFTDVGSSLFHDGRVLARDGLSLYGYYNTEGELVIPFTYEKAFDFSRGYATAGEENKVGLIDTNGKFIIPPKYESIIPFKDGLARASKVVNGKVKEGFIDIKGNAVIPFIYDRVYDFSEGLAKVEEGNRISFIDKSGRKIIALKESAYSRSFAEGYAIITNPETKKYGFMDKTGNIVIPCIYDDVSDFKDGTACVEKDNLWGLIDKNGKELTPISYESISSSHHGIPGTSSWSERGWAEIRKNGKKGIIDIRGKEVLPCIYKSLKEYKYSEGPVPVTIDNKWGYVNSDGKLIIPYEFDDASPFTSELAIVKKNGKEGMINKTGQLVIPCVYDQLGKLSDDGLSVFKENKHYGVINNHGTIVIPPIFALCSSFNKEGLALTNNYVISIKNHPSRFLSYIEASEKGYADAQYFRALYCFQQKNTEEGIKWLSKAAEQGLAVAQYMMGEAYRLGSGVEKDAQKAQTWYSRAAEGGNHRAQVQYGFFLAASDKCEEAVKWFKKGVDAGSDDAYFYLGKCYEEGLGVTRDLQEAARLYDWASKRNYDDRSAKAYIEVKKMIKEESQAPKKALDTQKKKVETPAQQPVVKETTPKEPKKVAKHRKAAEDGDAKAQFDLGLCYYKGEGVEIDYTEATKWFKKSAEQEYAPGQEILGYCYYKGEGVEQNYDQAVIWLSKAAHQGNARAQNNLGVCYRNGQGVKQDDAEAMKWYGESAKQGDYIGECNFGKGYLYGLGVEQDYTEAVKWLTKSANQDYAEAQYQLGLCYLNGTGVPKDNTRGKKWLEKAMNQGHHSAGRKLVSLQED